MKLLGFKTHYYLLSDSGNLYFIHGDLIQPLKLVPVPSEIKGKQIKNINFTAGLNHLVIVYEECVANESSMFHCCIKMLNEDVSNIRQFYTPFELISFSSTPFYSGSLESEQVEVPKLKNAFAVHNYLFLLIEKANHTYSLIYFPLTAENYKLFKRQAAIDFNFLVEELYPLTEACKQYVFPGRFIAGALDENFTSLGGWTFTQITASKPKNDFTFYLFYRDDKKYGVVSLGILLTNGNPYFVSSPPGLAQDECLHPVDFSYCTVMQSWNDTRQRIKKIASTAKCTYVLIADGRLFRLKFSRSSANSQIKFNSKNSSWLPWFNESIRTIDASGENLLIYWNSGKFDIIDDNDGRFSGASKEHILTATSIHDSDENLEQKFLLVVTADNYLKRIRISNHALHEHMYYQRSLEREWQASEFTLLPNPY